MLKLFENALDALEGEQRSREFFERHIYAEINRNLFYGNSIRQTERLVKMLG